MRTVRAISMIAVLGAAAAAACGGDGGDDDAIVVPPGPHHTFVATAIAFPTGGTSSQILGVDVDGRPEDGPDNQLGRLLGLFGTLFPSVNAQPPIDTGTARGDAIVLMSLRGPSLDEGPLELHVMSGRDPSPSACRDEADPTCGAHLSGSATFGIGDERADVPLTGLRGANRYDGGDGDARLPLVMGGRVVWLTLQRARAELTFTAPDRGGGKLGGAVDTEEIARELVPAYADVFRAAFDRDCDVGGIVPFCGCPAESEGADIRDMFDNVPVRNCQIADAEVEAGFAGFFGTDVDLDGDGLTDAMSIGVGFTVTTAVFSP
jgi:hypothetical protein